MTTPYAHQTRHLETRWDTPAWALLWEMGTGKSYATILTAARLYGTNAIDALVVIAPKGVYRNWEGEVEKHWPDGPVRPVVTTWGRKAPTTNRVGLRVFLMNVEALATARGELALLDWLQRHRALLVVDESTSIKNHKAKRTKALARLAPLAPYRRILTGSPVTQSPLDLYGQLSVLSPRPLGFSSFWAFRGRFAEVKKRKLRLQSVKPDGTIERKEREISEVVGYRKLDELKELLETCSDRVLKEDCLDLPPKVYQRREVELTDAQRIAYAEMVKESKAILEGATVTAPIALTQILRLHQIACGFVMGDDGHPMILHNHRRDALLEALDEAGGKAIVWCPYVPMIRYAASLLRQEYGAPAVVTYFGETSSDEREEAKRRFQEDPTCRFFVGNPQTAGYGLTLTAAKTVVYFANGWKLEERQQSEDRAHRIGLDHSVTYVDLVAPGTVDERILEALRSKRDIANEVLGEEWRTWIQ